MSCSHRTFHGGSLKYLNVLVAATLSALVLAGCSDTTSTSAEKSVTDSPAASMPTTENAAPEPDGSASHPYAFGTLAPSSWKSRWDVTVTETVVTGGSELVLADYPYNEVKDGWDYVLGRMSSVVNDNLPSADAGEPVSPTSVMPVFIGSDGRIYDIWNDNNSAVVLENDWVGQSDIIAKTGIESTGRFAIQVPSTAIPGGQFATRNEVDGAVVYFGEPVQ